jgi:hypothetical protein
LIQLRHYQLKHLGYWGTHVVCAVCNRFGCMTDATTPFGLCLCLEARGWRRLNVNWYTLWMCRTCQIEDSGGDWFFAAMHFGVIFPTAGAVEKQTREENQKGVLRHAKQKGTQTQQGIIPPGT